MYIPNLTKFVLTSTVLFIHVLILCSFEKRKLKRHVPGYNNPIYHSCISLFPYLFHCFDSWSASFPGRPKKNKIGRKPGKRQSTMAQKERPNNVQRNNGISQEHLVLFSIIFCCSRTIWYVIFHNQNKYCLNNIYVLLVSAIHKSKNRNGVSQSN